MGGWKNGGPGRWYHHGMRNERAESRGRGWSCGPRHHRAHAAPTSGNHAFDEYREETLRRLEDEQEEFHSFLESLRHAKDKAEFDDFMDERQRRTVEPEAGDEPEDAGKKPKA